MRFISEKSIIKEPNYLRDFVLHKIVYSIHEREGKRMGIKEGWEYVLNFIFALKNGVFGGIQYISKDDICSLKFEPRNRIYISIKTESDQIEDGKKKCPSCGFMVKIGFKFCPNCAHPFELTKPRLEEEIIDNDEDIVIMNLEESQESIRGWGHKLTTALYQDGINTIIEFVNRGLNYYLGKERFNNFRNLRNIFNIADEIVKKNI